jgi:hypothetical protein
MAPFRKKGAPILSSNAGWAWKGAHQCSDGGNRELLIDRIEWAHGWPSINNGTPSRGRHTAPALD